MTAMVEPQDTSGGADRYRTLLEITNAKRAGRLDWAAAALGC
jgi:hypothetical protein